jgi:hypothetical protein
LRSFAAKNSQAVEKNREKTPCAIAADAENAPARVEDYVPKIAMLTATLASGASASFMPRLRRTILSCRSRAAAANDSNLGSSGSLPSHSFSIQKRNKRRQIPPHGCFVCSPCNHKKKEIPYSLRRI